MNGQPPPYKQTEPLADPPPYEEPPSRSASLKQKDKLLPSGTIHHVLPTDTLVGLSIRYSVPLDLILSHNNLHFTDTPYSRSTLFIPFADVSHSPIESPEQERKRLVKRFQVLVKCESDEAWCYMRMYDWSVEEAQAAWREDVEWEKANGRRERNKGKSIIGRRSK
ncbi:hypothetical protein BC832DRAFT_622063 [Gaertneriomyces semiglobifer]|nr:hypothetical protein BC832DRAFT_622063 [Gaertneriomyces semiglobifer]